MNGDHQSQKEGVNLSSIKKNRKKYMCLPIKWVSIVGDYDVWLDIQNVVKELSQQRGLVWLVKDDEGALVLWLGGVLKILNVSSNNLSVCDKIALQ